MVLRAAIKAAAPQNSIVTLAPSPQIQGVIAAPTQTSRSFLSHSAVNCKISEKMTCLVTSQASLCVMAQPFADQNCWLALRQPAASWQLQNTTNANKAFSFHRK
jgi:hypothetical protein